jgi:hypothetical protein
MEVSWVYFPTADVLWGQSPTGDVDIGHWWIENDSYCRAWRRWLKAETKCWQLGSAADGRILWYSLDGGLTGRSLLWHGNALSNLSDRFLTQTADAAADLNELEPQSGTMPRPRAQADSEQGFTPQKLGHATDAASPSPAIAAGETNALGMHPMSSPVTGGVLTELRSVHVAVSIPAVRLHPSKRHRRLLLNVHPPPRRSPIERTRFPAMLSVPLPSGATPALDWLTTASAIVAAQGDQAEAVAPSGTSSGR